MNEPNFLIRYTRIFVDVGSVTAGFYCNKNPWHMEKPFKITSIVINTHPRRSINIFIFTHPLWGITIFIFTQPLWGIIIFIFTHPLWDLTIFIFTHPLWGITILIQGHVEEIDELLTFSLTSSLFCRRRLYRKNLSTLDEKHLSLPYFFPLSLYHRFFFFFILVSSFWHWLKFPLISFMEQMFRCRSSWKA